MESDKLKRTPLYDEHVLAGARMDPFAGYLMPIQFTGILEEHLAVRQAAGLFDVSHMGEIYLTGREALPLLQHLITNNASSLSDGRAQYTVMCRPNGGIIDDLLVYRLEADRYMLVVNASNVEKDLAWILSQAVQFDVKVDDASDRTALLALQGPATKAVLERLSTSPSFDSLKSFHFVPSASIGDRTNVLLSRTGYTGEIGVEIYCTPDDAVVLWRLILEACADLGVLPAGLGARDTLRLEAGLPLYGNEMDEATNPIEAGLSWVVKASKGGFVGRDALIPLLEDRPQRTLVGIVMDERGIPRRDYELLDGDRVVGTITSGSQSPVLKRGIALGYLENDPQLTSPGSPISVRIRGRALSAHVARPPFHKI